MNKHNWKEISLNLQELYDKYELSSSYDMDYNYLKYSYHKIEDMWKNIYSKIDKVNFIIVSEAPLFGNKETYIYNENTPLTSFFTFNDIKCFSNLNLNKNSSNLEKKMFIIEQFIKNGVIVLDLFPFAFNQYNTVVNYKKMSKPFYKDILLLTEKSYLIPKIEDIFIKNNGIPVILYRYKRLYEKTDNHLFKVLNRLGYQYDSDFIHSKNIPLDRDKLIKIIKNKDLSNA